MTTKPEGKDQTTTIELTRQELEAVTHIMSGLTVSEVPAVFIRGAATTITKLKAAAREVKE